MDAIIELIYVPGDLEQTVCRIVAFIVILDFVALVTSFLGRIGR